MPKPMFYCVPLTTFTPSAQDGMLVFGPPFAGDLNPHGVLSPRHGGFSCASRGAKHIMPYILISTDILNDLDIYELGEEEAWRRFRACVLKGETNEFTPFIHPDQPSGTKWQKLRLAVFDRDKYTCVYCGATDEYLECDHVVPRSRGGKDTIENLVTACVGCNRRKTDRTPEEWQTRR